VLITGVAWRDYVIVREAIDSPGVKMTYCEIMGPSRGHEYDKKIIAGARLRARRVLHGWPPPRG
jgi:hypothetical protein